MRLLLQTPDLLLKVIELSDIDTLFSLRLTSRGIHNLISLYESTISQAVAKVTFRTDGLLLRPPSDGKCSIRWLISLIPKQLATIAVDRGHFDDIPNFYGVSAENPEGDPVRERVDRGWRILQRLSLIARNISMISEGELLSPKYHGKSSLFPLTRRKRELEITARSEHLVTETRLEYCRTLGSSDILDYRLMEHYVHPCIHNVHIHLRDMSRSRTNWTQLLRTEQKNAELMLGWMKWFILKEGPSLFWEQWWRQGKMTPQYTKQVSGLSALDRMLQAYHSRSKEQIKIEAEAASCIASYFQTNQGSSELVYLEEMRKERESSYETGQTPQYVGHTLASVPFLFEQCPLTHKKMDLDSTILYPKQRTELSSVFSAL